MRRVGILFICLSVAGCAQIQAEWELSNGLTPVVASSEITQQVASQYNVVESIAQSAKLSTPYDYYQVTLAGFNSIDDACTKYLNAIYRVDRNKSAANALLAAVQTTAAGTMLATGADATAISIMAQAFGLAQGATTIIANSRLYQVPPTTVFEINRKLSRKYRDEVKKVKSSIDNSPTVYRTLSEYLELCLPVRLEAEIDAVLKRAIAGTTDLEVRLY